MIKLTKWIKNSCQNFCIITTFIIYLLIHLFIHPCLYASDCRLLPWHHIVPYVRMVAHTISVLLQLRVLLRQHARRQVGQRGERLLDEKVDPSDPARDQIAAGRLLEQPLENGKIGLHGRLQHLLAQLVGALKILCMRMMWGRKKSQIFRKII